MVKFLTVTILVLGVTNSSFALAKEKPLPAFRITGYIEKIEPGTIKIFVPRMKQSMALLLAKNMKITNFADNEDKIWYSIKDLREKDLAVCAGVISAKGFICQSIAFVRNSRVNLK